MTIVKTTGKTTGFAKRLIWASVAVAALASCESHNRGNGAGSSGSSEDPGSQKNTNYFAEICARSDNPADVQKTIAVLKEVAGNDDCQGANDYFGGVTSLSLAAKGISNLMPLKGFRVLKELNLDGNSIDSLDALTELRGLTSFSAANNRIRSVSPLAYMDKLVAINLDNNQVDSIVALNKLKFVADFTMRDNPLGDGPIKKTSGNCDTASASAAIANWCSPSTPFLEICRQGSSADRDERHTVNAIKAMLKATSCEEANGKLSRMETLKLPLKEIVSVAPLRGQKQLKVLDLSYNYIKDVSPLSNLESLTYLSLYSNRIESIEGLSTLSRLNTLNLTFNYITSFMPLRNLRNLLHQPNTKDHKALRAEYNPLGCREFIDSEYCTGRRAPVERTKFNCPFDAKSDAIADWCRYGPNFTR